MDRGLRREVELADAAVHHAVPRVDGDRLGGAAGRDAVVVGDVRVGRARRARAVVLAGEPHGDAAGRGPEGVTAEADAVAAGHGRPEAVPAVGEARDVVARDPADGLKLAGGGIRVADGEGRAEPADVGLRGVAEHRICHPVRRRVEDVAGEKPREGALVPGVMAGDGRGPPGEIRGKDLAQGVVGGREVAGQVDVRNVEGGGRLVVAVRLAILGELPANLQPWGRKEVAEGVLVFVAVQAAAQRAALARDALPVGRGDFPAEGAGEVGHRRRVWAPFFGGRHLARGDAVVDPDPALLVGRVVGFESEGLEVEAALAVDVVVAACAVRLEKGGASVRRGRREGRGGCR